jgi:membrane protein YqaA with SNARE-associated domain
MDTPTILLALLGSSVASALVPVVNAEALVLVAAAAVPHELVAVVATMGAAGQMAGKVVLYRGGRGVGVRASARSGRAAETAARLRDRPGALTLLYFLSAVLGLPPFYLMSLVAGIASLQFGVFLVLGFLGRFIRFYALAAVPGLF